MVAGGQKRRIDRDVDGDRAFRRARAFDQLRHRGRAQMRRPEPPRPGHERVDTAMRAGGGDFLLIAGAFGEHAQIQHGARAIVEIDDDIAVVPDIGCLIAVTLVAVIDGLPGTGHDPHGLGPGGQPHEIEEMAAFLDHGAAGIAVEAVPGPDLGQEGKAMFADREHLHSAGRGIEPVQEGSDRRHIAIFHRHPDRRRIARAQRLQPGAVFGAGEDRLFHQHRQRPAFGDAFQLPDMRGIGRGDDKAIQIAPRQQVVERIAEPRLGRDLRRRLAHPRIGFMDRSDPRAGQQADIAQMFLPHHPATDDAIADCVRRHTRSPT